MDFVMNNRFAILTINEGFEFLHNIRKISQNEEKTFVIWCFNYFFIFDRQLKLTENETVF